MASRAKATILDIAREAGVSKSTVSLVLQGSGLIRPETALKVRKAIEDVGYVYNRGAANLRKAHSNVIGMVINETALNLDIPAMFAAIMFLAITGVSLTLFMNWSERRVLVWHESVRTAGGR